MAVALVALVVAASGGAYAAATVTSPTMTACVHHAAGSLYVARRCARGDQRLTWNVSGPVGPTGPQGATGLKGVQGPTGAQGATGLKGVQGPTGAQGATGPRGDAGPKGDTGAPGDPGTARAYGRIDTDGATVTQSKNIESVTNPSPGMFCIALDPSIDVTTTVPLVHTDANGDITDLGPNASLAWAESSSTNSIGGVGSCPDGQIIVVTGTRTEDTGPVGTQTAVTSVTNTLVNQPFFIAVP
jgi:hypothetical protein